MEKMDKQLVTHVGEQLFTEFCRLVELENLKGLETNNSAYLKNIIQLHVNSRRTEYLLLSSVFKQNREN